MPTNMEYNGVHHDQPIIQGVFAGQKFWFSNTVPQRGRFIEEVKAYGGEVVPLEKQADICLYDHARKNPPPGMYSYRYVEYSVRAGQREDLEAHRIGGISSRAERPVGSVTLASKGSRTPFSEADDQMLWSWLKPLEGMRGSAGNAIYQQLEAANPRHTYQSWRDRWLKRVQFEKRDAKGNRVQHKSTAPVVNQSTTTKTNLREAPVSSIRPAPISTIAVEVPLENSPKRKRDRPRQTAEKNLNADTIEVAGPAILEQSLTPSRSTRNGKAGKLQVERTSSSKPKDDAGSWEFSDEERNLLLKAVDVILGVPEEDAGAAWGRLAESYDDHTAQQWRDYFYEVVLPLYHRQQRQSVTGTGASQNVDGEVSGGVRQLKIATESTRVKLERDNGAETRPTQMEENRDGESETTASEPQRRQQSPSPDPESPADWRSENGRPRPGPNESRKRSSAKSNSQDSGASQLVDSAPGLAQDSQTITAEGSQDKDDIEEANSQPSKRRKLSLDEGTALEIPSTPQESATVREKDLLGTNQESESLEEGLPGTPTPRARRRPGHGSDHSFSPLSASPDTKDEEESLPTNPKPELRRTETIDSAAHTSPISVHLVSDHDASIPSSSSAPNRASQTESTGSPTPEFETAPEFSQIHEDNPEQDETPEAFETAAEEQHLPPKRPVLDTQALFAGPTQDSQGSLDLGLLREPEGGWDLIDPDVVVPSNDLTGREDETTAPISPTSSTTSSLDLDLDTWLHLRTTQGRDPALLLAAAKATCMHKALADTVYEELKGGRGIPGGVRGVWTKEDDEVLLGSDARGIERVEAKHGRRGVRERWECLGVWSG